jgi:hemin uptake protein HemP
VQRADDAGATEQRPGSAPAGPWVQSPALFQGRREIIIVHRGQQYRLRITKADKLILTK